MSSETNTSTVTEERYKTDNLGLIAYLITLGYRFDDISVDAGRVSFSLINVPQALVEDYFSARGTVPAFPYYRNLIQVRRAVALHVRRSIHGINRQGGGAR